MHKGKYEEGLKVARIAMDKDGGSFMAHRAAGLCYLSLGYEKEAIEILTVAAQLSNRHPWVLFDLIGAYATLANNEEAQSIMEEAMEHVNLFRQESMTSFSAYMKVNNGKTVVFSDVRFRQAQPDR
ncbi:MAG: tetratricopeptide repeat protein [Flammeovirgaceae bacterium]|nr:tetratricopeptide repeat protein [Flammeovirgaceae bacterium]